ncbi:hypothetical protein DOTSEDRAFT_37584 [Dothistroma septosporum NZE10]|uniref:F-box domain-containing protein n=1 Tax=Dothistroma septosporum (strain NZE10 / CBS 128990) TaxID=675120 RepID=N1PEQ0_DOTSN|nr:hypothetical protein DOTSEDRAFT_37584 [Dothistroma septosporum NZE10]
MQLLKALFPSHDQGRDHRKLDTGTTVERHSTGWRWPSTPLKRRPSSEIAAESKRSSTTMSMLEIPADFALKQRRPDPTNNTSGKCHLLEIPAEIRNKIWEATFTGTTIKLAASTTMPGLLLTCKQINLEAQGACWRLSEFKSWNIMEIRDFLTRVGAKKLELIQHVTYDSASTLELSSRVRDVTGIAHSAFMAQWDLFWMEDWLRGEGWIWPPHLKLKAPFMAADGELVTCDSPWQTFGRRLGQESAFSLATGASREVGQLCLHTRSSLVQTVAAQSRFFGYEHQDWARCWSTKWCVVPGYQCGCPARVGRYGGGRHGARERLDAEFIPELSKADGLIGACNARRRD